MTTAWWLEEALTNFAAAGRFAPLLIVAISADPDHVDEYGMVGSPDLAGRGRKAAEFQRFVTEFVLPAVRKHYGARPARRARVP